ncbi:diguanylate cyclase [uncultured Xylophilus sp.]|uniref:sensor domain-containing diguanylate cyclase n=1 Tax=uncultured Xylophilus sp. TaxID=296832 RepID=UPI0025D0A124|nr:diguanylate cyclase [uncultured Xylophilus sp.]
MPQRFSQLRFASQIALVFGALIVVVVLLLTAVFGDVLRARVRADAGVVLHGLASGVSRQLEAQLQTRAEQAVTLARAESLWERGLDSAAARQLVARVQTLTPENLWIGVADTDGIVRAATGDLLVGVSVAQRPWFQAGRERPYVGDVHPAALLAKLLPPTASGEPQRFMDFAAPIELDGVLRGVLGIHANWEWVNEVIRLAVPADLVQKDLRIFVFDATGRLVYAPFGDGAASGASGSTFQAPAPPAQSRGGTTTGVVRWSDGQDYLTAVAPVRAASPITDLGWRVVVREPVATAYRQAGEVGWAAAGVGLTAATVAAWLAYRAARRLTRNLGEIALAARSVEGGRSGAVLPLVGGSAEVSALSTALRSMTRELLGANARMEQEVRDRTRELVAANAELDRQARSDPLTGLLNRRGFDERLAQALPMARRTGLPLSAVMIDADHFKRVNDRFGHEVGDTVLQFLAVTMQSRTRASDSAARLGGEEFGVLLPDTDAAGAVAMGEALRAAVSGYEDPVFGRITISIGVATLQPGDAGASDLLRHADEALYRAKHEGRDCVRIWAPGPG